MDDFRNLTTAQAQDIALAEHYNKWIRRQYCGRCWICVGAVPNPHTQATLTAVPPSSIPKVFQDGWDD